MNYHFYKKTLQNSIIHGGKLAIMFFTRSGGLQLKQYTHYLVILACLIATFFLYNKQLGAIPLLILSGYLFFLAFREFYKIKNNK